MEFITNFVFLNMLCAGRIRAPTWSVRITDTNTTKSNMNKYTQSFLKSIFAASLLAGSLATAAEASATYPKGYYDSLEGKCGAALMKAIKGICANHTVISYGDNTWNAFKDTDTHMVNGKLVWWDMYCTDLVSATNGHSGLNIEHSVANSWWGGSKNDAYKDIVHLNPSNSKANNAKGNYPLAEVGTLGSSSQNASNFTGKVGKAVSGQGDGATWVYEPADEYKGDFARAFMYMFCVYDNINWKAGTDWMYDTSSDLMFKPWAYNLLLKWSANDPVGDKERMRNDGIQKHQKNRNPFIDFPDLAEHIWGSKKNIPFSLSGAAPDPGTDPDPIEPDQQLIYTWLPQTDTAMPSDWTIDNVTLPEGSNHIWSWKTLAEDKSHYLNASAYINGAAKASKSYIWSPEVNYENVLSAKISFDHAAKFQTNCKNLCKLVVKNEDNDRITEVNIDTWPATGSWNFSSSGDIDLPKISAKSVRIGLKYESTADGADTWEIRNMKLTLERSTSGIGNCLTDPECDDSDQVGVYGNNIFVPEGATIFDLNGRQVDGMNLQPGIYIVVKPTFKKNLKIAIQ